MQFLIISHFFFIKVSSDIKMGLCFLEKNCHRISEISFLPSIKAKSARKLRQFNFELLESTLVFNKLRCFGSVYSNFLVK